MIIKICGLNDASNLKKISALPFDWVGYNFYKPSPRFLDIADPSFLTTNQKRVGVFVNASHNEIQDTIQHYKLNKVQLHGDEDVEFCEKLSQLIEVIKVFRINDNFDFSSLDDFTKCAYYLFDTASSSYGGTGKAFDWSLLKNITIPRPFLLSGGIGPDDVDKIKQFSHPNFYGVDINSRFELSPGIKDIEAVSTFISKIID
jgi:phosphoribosylanthranilate isomerase